MAMRYFDTHCHLQDERFGLEIEAVLGRAREAGLSHMVCCGSHEGDWPSVLDLANRHVDVIPMLGLHPWYVDEASPQWFTRLERLASEGNVGIGECGLDFALENFNRERQESVFRVQLKLACELNRPVSIHCRRAWEALISILRDIGIPCYGAAIHAFSGSAEVAVELQRLGLHISYSCSLANPTNKRAAKSILAVSEDRLLFETDAPDIPPRFAPGLEHQELNEPANIHLVAQAAARIRSVDIGILAEKVHENSGNVFGSLIQKQNND